MLFMKFALATLVAAVAVAASSDPEPFPNHARGEWEFYEVEGTQCMNAKTTGVWLKRGDSSKLMVYHAQGGACFNAITCAAAATAAHPFKPSNTGLFSDSHNNPAANFTIVFIPYCTGDVFAGNAESQFQLQYRHFAGHKNEKLIMDRVYATFPSITDLLVTGESAGGFGSAINYDFIRRYYPASNVRATLVDDSGPILANEFMATCLQKIQLDTWNYTEALPPGCPCAVPGMGLDTVWVTIKKNWPQDTFGLISSLNDVVISAFFAFGLDDCKAVIPLGYNKMAAGLRNLALKHKNELSIFMLPGSAHTHSTNGDFLRKESAGIYLHEWYGELMRGKQPASVDPEDAEADYDAVSNNVQLERLMDAYNHLH